MLQPQLNKHKYKLTYFDGKGRAEVIRLMLAAADLPFEDHRISTTDWHDMKSRSPWGSIPILEVDGMPLAQTPAIVAYLAQEQGYRGHGNWEHGLVDSVVITANDLYNEAWVALKIKDPLAANTRKFKETSLPNALQQFESFISQYGEQGHAVGGKLSSADVAIFWILDLIQIYNGITEGTLDNYPKVKGVMQKVNDNSRLSEYLKRRPESAF